MSVKRGIILLRQNGIRKSIFELFCHINEYLYFQVKYFFDEFCPDPGRDLVNLIVCSLLDIVRKIIMGEIFFLKERHFFPT